MFLNCLKKPKEENKIDERICALILLTQSAENQVQILRNQNRILTKSIEKLKKTETYV